MKYTYKERKTNDIQSLMSTHVNLPKIEEKNKNTTVAEYLHNAAELHLILQYVAVFEMTW
jgi:hypothetical protein